jgi:hypothetical protein
MKTIWIFRTIFIAASLAVGCFPLSGHAQTEAQTLSVNVPFGFELGSKHLAPGIYTVSRPLRDIVEIRNGSDSAMIITHAGQTVKASKTSKVVFDRYGDHYFLRQVWFTPQDNTYMECAESKTEKQAKKSELASTTKKASNVELALLRIP